MTILGGPWVLLFYLLANLSLYCIINTKHLVVALLNLVLTTVWISSILISIGVEFLPLIFIAVYVGAIAILFLFVLMILQVNPEDQTSKPNGIYLIITGINLSVFLSILYSYLNSYESIDSLVPLWEEYLLNGSHSNLVHLATTFYDHITTPFILCGLILLLGIVAAISLAGFQASDTKSQNIHEQQTKSNFQSYFKG